MRDLLSKLDAIVSETALKDKADLEAKRQALQDLQMDPTASSDPEIKQAIIQRKADLEKEAKSKGFDEEIDFDQIRKDAADHIKKSIDKQSDDRIAKLKADREKGPDSFMNQVGKKIIGGVKGAVKGAARGFSGKEEIEEDVYQIGDDFGISFSEDFEVGTEIVDILEDGIVIELDDTALEYLTQNGFTFEEINLDEAKKKGLDGKACWKGYRYAGTKMKGGKRVDNCVKVGESQVAEGESYGNMPADAIRTLHNVYQKVSQGVEPHHDKEGADRISKALDDAAQELGVSKYMKSLYYSASQSAHMDFDTNPGGFENWFKYVGDHLEGLYNIHKEKGSYDNDEPDVEVEKEDLELEAKYQGREVPLGKPMKGDVKKSKVYVKNAKGNVVKVNFGDKKMRIKKSNPNRRKSFRARHNCATAKDRTTARYWSCRAW